MTLPNNTVVNAELTSLKADITRISPTSGAAGSTVTLTGTKFGTTQGTSFVSFGGVAAASYTSWADTRVVCLVPAGVEGKVQVTLTTAGYGTSNAVVFDVLTPPVLSGVDPASGVASSTVTLSGAEFGDTQGTSSVSFGGVAAASYTSWADTRVVCLVPAGVEGKVQVTLTTAGYGTSNAVVFDVLTPPVLSGVDPASGVASSTVTLSGAEFGDTQGTSSVSFGGVAAASYTSWTDTQVVCLVPAGVEGEVQVTVTTEDGTSNGVTFDVLTPPVLSGIDPARGVAGSTVTLSGTDFGDTQGASSVSFGGVAAASYTSWSDTQVACLVPAGIEGPLQVTLTTTGGTSNGVTFDVLTPPVLSGIDPARGVAGSTVTLSGTDFGDTQGTSSISFGSTLVASYTSWSDTGITCVVPAGIEGEVQVTVTTEDGTSNSLAFDVLTPPVLSGVDPARGVAGSVGDPERDRVRRYAGDF